VPELVLHHVHFGQHGMLQVRRTARVRDHGPQCTGQLGAVGIDQPPFHQVIAGLAGRGAAQERGVAAVEIALHGIGQRRARFAVLRRMAMQFVVVHRRQPGHQLVGEPAQHGHRQAHADDRAVRVTIQLPQAAAL
jgi:hypothetical protein